VSDVNQVGPLEFPSIEALAERYDGVKELAVTGVIDGRIVYANLALEELLGTSDLVGRDVQDFTGALSYTRLTEFASVPMVSEVGRMIMTTTKRADGEYVPVYTFSRAVLIAGQPGLLHGTERAFSSGLLGDVLGKLSEVEDYRDALIEAQNKEIEKLRGQLAALRRRSATFYRAAGALFLAQADHEESIGDDEDDED
jgi:PAS domain-containing protein